MFWTRVQFCGCGLCCLNKKARATVLALLERILYTRRVASQHVLHCCLLTHCTMVKKNYQYFPCNNSVSIRLDPKSDSWASLKGVRHVDVSDSFRSLRPFVLTHPSVFTNVHPFMPQFYPYPRRVIPEKFYRVHSEKAFTKYYPVNPWEDTDVAFQAQGLFEFVGELTKERVERHLNWYDRSVPLPSYISAFDTKGYYICTFDIYVART